MLMVDSYEPQLNDYVIWRNVEGWVYFICEEYITIEIAVKTKCDADLEYSPLHKMHHCLIVCYHLSSGMNLSMSDPDEYLHGD